MIKYSLYQKNPASHYVYIDLHIDNVDADKMQFQLPAWRPGRYELGNFAKNVKRLEVFDSEGRSLQFQKINKDLWEVNTGKSKALKITYSYFAAELNAGACYADTNQVYINPVHCCLMVIGRLNEEHSVTLDVPDNYKIATSLQVRGRELLAKNYEELVDSPFMASADIKSDHYIVNGIKFYLHFCGECRPDFSLIKKDFIAFTEKQFEFWSDFPSDEYHFLFQVLPIKFYHGVEHAKSTVIAIGPGYSINSGSTYEDILGVSSHELFHTWNVKTIRPAEMNPYDYTKENYARTGYVYEGFTTYYGDKILLSSHVFDLQQYFKTFEERLIKHFHNYGRYNLSVADSSWETWLDGYVPGAPYRKTNIYDEGSLIAFMLDVKILAATGNKRSLRDLCALLYERFGKNNIGYTEQDIMTLANEVSGKDLTSFFKEFVYSPSDFEIPLKDCLAYIGLNLVKQPSAQASESNFGFKVIDQGHISKIALVAPYSPAWKAGIFAGDEVLAINKVAVRSNFNSWLNYFQNEKEITLHINSAEQIKTILLQPDKKGNTWFFTPLVKEMESPTNEQKEAFEAWKKL